MKTNLTPTLIAAAAFAALSTGASAGTLVIEKQIEVRQQAPVARAETTAQAGRFVENNGLALSIRPAPWTVKNGSSLHDTLVEWTAVSGWALNWDLPEDEDFILGAGHDFQGDFKTAVKDLFAAMPQKIRLTVDLLASNVPPLVYVSRDEGMQK